MEKILIFNFSAFRKYQCRGGGAWGKICEKKINEV